MTILNEHTADFQRGVINADWTFVLPDGRRETRHVFTRMLMPHEIVAMFRRAGFDEIELLGSTEGEPFYHGQHPLHRAGHAPVI